MTSQLPLHSHRLDNGLTVLIVPRPGCGVVTCDVWVDVGSADEPPELNGVSHFLEHMLFKGTERRGVGEIDRTVESLGGYLNAGTSHDFTHYYVMAAAEHFATLVDILADVLRHSTLDAAELDRERQVILEEYRRKQDDPHGFLWDSLYEEAFAAGPYKASVLGEPATLDAITREKMLDYYDRLYCPERMALIVVGDVDPTAALAVVAEAMDGFDRRPRPLVARESLATAYAPGVLRLFDKDVHETYGVLSFPAPPLRDPAETYALDVLQFVLGGGDASVLYQEIQEKRRLATSIHAGCANSRYPDLFYIFYTCEDAKREALEAAVLEQIEILRAAPVAPAALQRARKLLTNSHAFSLETTSGQSGSIGYYHCITGTTDFESHYAEGIRVVTAERVMEQARRWLDPAARMHVAIRRADGKGALGMTAAPGIRVHTLANGCRVALRPTPGKDILAIVAGARWGARDDQPDEAGLAHLMARLLIKGTARRTALEIAETMESVGGSIEPYCGHDLLGLETQTVVEDWPVALEVLSDCLFASNFPDAEFDKERAIVQAEIRRAEDEKFSYTYHKFLELYYGRHPYGTASEGDVETLAALERAEVAALHGRVARSDMMVLVAVGNVPEEEFLREVERRFPPAAATSAGSASASTPAPARRRVIHAPGLGAGHSLTIRKPVAQGFIVAGYPAPPARSPEGTALRLACGVLGEGMSARLFARLRDRDHLAYAIGASLVNRELASHLIVYVGTGPATIESAREGLLREVAGLRDDRPDAEEFERARRYILGKHLLGRQTNSVLAQGMVAAELAGLGWDWADRFPERMAAVTPEAALEAARAHFRSPALAILRPSGEPIVSQGSEDEEEASENQDR